MKRICPKCNEEIASLRNVVTGGVEYYLSLDSRGNIQYEANFKTVDYLCPKCDEILFTSEAEAIIFLKGGQA